MQPELLKSIGYLISTLSVALLTYVTWAATEGEPAIRIALLVGAAAAIAGMGLRWLSYRIEHRRRLQPTRSGQRPARPAT